MELSTVLEKEFIVNRKKDCSRSKRYKTLPTATVLKKLSKAGYDVTAVSTVNKRDKSKSRYAKHLLRLRKRDSLNCGDSIPEIIIINSHDGTSSYKLFLGVYRFACANGLIVGDTFKSVSIRHTKGKCLSKEVLKAVKMLMKEEKTLKSVIESMNATSFDHEVIKDLTDKVNERFDLNLINPNSLLTVRRNDDSGNSAWKVLNRMQENILKGGLQYFNEKGQLRRKKRITSIDSATKINRELWSMVQSSIN